MIGCRDAVLLLPRLPRSATLVAGPARLLDDLAVWDIACSTGPSPAELAVSDDADAAAGSDADLIVLFGRDPNRRLAARGYDVMTYDVRPVGGSALALVPAGHAGWPAVRDRYVDVTAAARLRAAVGRVRRSRDIGALTIAARATPVLPAVLAAAGATATVPVVFGADPRQRAAFHLLSRTVVKASRTPGEAGRAEDEQAMLVRVRSAVAGAHVPAGRGWGEVDGIAWSAESTMGGVPLSSVARGRARRSLLAVLDGLVTFFTELGAATRDAAAWAEGGLSRAALLPLEHDELVSIVPRLSGVPSVLAHGDVGSGGNVLVRGDDVAVIDWETARTASLPLLDLLPVVCLALATNEAPDDIARQAAFVLELCAGSAPESRWLLDHVGRYLDAVGAPRDAAGQLAALAWAHQRGLRLEHDALLARAGLDIPEWTPPAEEVGRRWLEASDLGLAWPALIGATS